MILLEESRTEPNIGHLKPDRLQKKNNGSSITVKPHEPLFSVKGAQQPFDESVTVAGAISCNRFAWDATRW